MGHHAFLRKPLATILEHDRLDYGEGKVCRTFGLFSLSCIGMASTIGSGVFVLSGRISNEIAGTAGIISWALAGLGCAICGASYAELSCRIPASGGPYAFVYNLMGEVFAVLVCWLISLEFGIAGAAVSRAWSDKLYDNMTNFYATDVDFPPYTSNALATALMIVCVFLTATGIELSKEVVSFFVVLKIVLLLFMIIAAFTLWHSDNLAPFAPYGAQGVLQGTTIAFFSYAGFDEPCVFAAEAINARCDVPLSLMITIGVAASLYILSSLALSAAAHYTAISPTSAFSDVFHDNGLDWAGHITSLGELVVIPSVALASFMAQPKVLYILARDGLLPSSLAAGSKFLGFDTVSLWCGLVCVILAALLPFNTISNLISAGILLAYTFSHTCLIILRISETDPAPIMTNGETKFWKIFGIGPAVGLLFIMKAFEYQTYNKWFFVMCGSGSIFMIVYVLATLSIVRCCPMAPIDDKEGSFALPKWCFPWLPAIGILLNWGLITMLDWVSLGGFVVYIVGGLMHYFFYGHSHSVGYRLKWHISNACGTEHNSSSETMADNETDIRPDTTPPSIVLNLKSELHNSTYSEPRSRGTSNMSDAESSMRSRKPRATSLSKGYKDL